MKLYKTLSELMKFNISFLVIVTCYLGYYLGLRSIDLNMTDLYLWLNFLFLVLGTFISSSGASVLNQYIERYHDAKMDRTKNRPIPLKKISSFNALIIGLLLCVVGPLILYLKINFLTAMISFLTIVIYLFVYTPLKRITSLNTIVGSVPGALPPVGGWAAATGEINEQALMLFGILFCWQIPHFLSLAILYKEDYKKAGYKMLPSITSNNNEVLFQILFFTMALLYTSIGIYFLNLTSIVYVCGAILLGLIFLFYSSAILFEYSNKSVKKIFIFSIIYLPLLLVMIILDTIFY